MNISKRESIIVPNNAMRLFVGTLYTNENEFDECVQSINKQSYKNFDHYVFRNLPNKEAHVTLYKSFLEKANDYDVLVKVDADMVLTRASLFEDIVNKLETNGWLDLFAIAVYDFFSDQLIWGLNAYRNTVRWNFENEDLFVDIPEVPSNKLVYDKKDLAPAATHCKNPSPYQAFHYGIHRGLKVIQPDKAQAIESYSRSHWKSLERTWTNFQKTRDIRIGLASLGAELAYAGTFSIQDLDYTNPKISNTLELYLSLDAKGLYREVRRRRVLNWGILPGSKRRMMLRRLYKGPVPE